MVEELYNVVETMSNVGPYEDPSKNFLFNVAGSVSAVSLMATQGYLKLKDNSLLDNVQKDYAVGGTYGGTTGGITGAGIDYALELYDIAEDSFGSEHVMAALGGGFVYGGAANTGLGLVDRRLSGSDGPEE